jgi:heme exporter protein D
MIPELGKHAATVLSAYGISIAIILGLVAVSLLQSRAAKRDLAALQNVEKTHD